MFTRFWIMKKKLCFILYFIQMWDKIRKTENYQLCGKMGLIISWFSILLVLICLLSLCLWWSWFNLLTNTADSGINFALWCLFLFIPIFLFVFIYYIVKLGGIFIDNKTWRYKKKVCLKYDIGFFLYTFELLSILIWLSYFFFF